MSKLKIQDESNDKKYFTIIPNFVLNHSTHWDREVYIQMKRKAGENGTCYISINNLMKQCGLSKDRLLKSIKYLLRHNWIQKIGERKIKTKGGNQFVNEYQINDIWKLNTDFYEDSPSNKGSPSDKQPFTQGSPSNPSKVVRQTDTKNNLYKEEPNKNNTKVLQNDEFGNPTINSLISLLKEKMGLKMLDGTIKENRQYCYLSIKKFKKQGVEAIIEIASKHNFWSTRITGFKTLYYNGVKIMSVIREQQNQVAII